MSDAIRTRPFHPVRAASERRGYRINQWAHEVGVSRAYVYASLLDKGLIESVKVGRARVIVTTPDEFLAALPRV
jgi:hypothetical protein